MYKGSVVYEIRFYFMPIPMFRNLRKWGFVTCEIIANVRVI